MKYSTKQIAKAERMAVLMVRYMLDIISPREHDELDKWVGENDLNMQLFEEMTHPTKIADHLNQFVKL